MNDIHKSALIETALIAVITVVPTLFLLFKIIFASEPLELSTLSKSGEFFLYGVSFLGSSFLVYNHHKLKKSDKCSILSFISLIFIIIFAIAYTSISNTNSPNLEAVQNYSILALIIALPIFYYAQVVSNEFSSTDVGSTRRGEQKLIEDSLK